MVKVVVDPSPGSSVVLPICLILIFGTDGEVVISVGREDDVLDVTAGTISLAFIVILGMGGSTMGLMVSLMPSLFSRRKFGAE